MGFTLGLRGPVARPSPAEPLGDLRRELARRAVDQHGFSGLELGVLSRAAYDDAAGLAIAAAVTSLSLSGDGSQQIPLRLSFFDPIYPNAHMSICGSLCRRKRWDVLF
jgi:hypothetical protein